MRIWSKITDNRGIVQRTLDNERLIEIKLPRGGTIQCRNKGFEVGEVVCFTLDPMGHITNILPIDVALTKVEIAENRNIQNAIEAIKGDDYEDSDVKNVDGNRYGHPCSTDKSCTEHREITIGGEDYPEYSPEDEYFHWYDDIREDATEIPGQTIDNGIHIQHEYGYFPEMGIGEFSSDGGSTMYDGEGDIDSYPWSWG